MSIFQKAKKAKENKKGFTLVELIVVIVILAILAAIMVPSLVGYIDKTKDRQVVINGSNLYKAMQTFLSEKYAEGKPAPAKIKDNFKNTDDAGEVFKLAEMSASDEKIEKAKAYYDSSTADVKGKEYKITVFEYQEGGVTRYYVPSEKKWVDKEGDIPNTVVHDSYYLLK